MISASCLGQYPRFFFQKMPLKLTLALGILATLLFPTFHLLFLAPYLVLCYYSYSRFKVLWRALGCGLFVDLLAAGPELGLNSLTFVMTSWILYGQNRNFFRDKVTTLPLMTFFFSVLATLLGAIFNFFFSHGVHLSASWAFTDLLVMPLCDAAFAALFAMSFHLSDRWRKLRSKRRRER